MTSPHSARTGTIADTLYDAFYSGGIAGSIVALFFLVLDAIEGQPFFTPSLMGTVLFSGVPAEAATGSRLDMMAYYTATHFVAFTLLGLGIACLVREVELHTRHPAIVLLVSFILLEVAFFAVASVLMPGVVERVGPARIAAANLLAAAGISAFLIAAHRPDLWERIKGSTE